MQKSNIKMENDKSKFKNELKNKKQRIAQITQMLFWFLRLKEKVILLFRLSFCFLNFDISFLVKRLLRLNEIFFLMKQKFMINSYYRGFYG
jgi:hypothetical protein